MPFCTLSIVTNAFIVMILSCNFRRFLLHRPQVPPGGLLEFPQITSVEEDEETDLDIFRKSVALLKETMIKC